MKHHLLLADARQHLEAAVRLLPDHPRYHASLGEALLACGEFQAGLDQLERAHELSPTPRTAWQLAVCYVQVGRPAETEQLVNRLVAEGEACPRALYARGLARFRTRLFAGAIADMRDALGFTDGAIEFHTLELARTLLGAVQAADGQASGKGAAHEPRSAWLQEAVARLRELETSGGNDTERLRLLGCALLMLGDRHRARALLCKALSAAECDAVMERMPEIVPSGLRPLDSIEMLRFLVRGEEGLRCMSPQKPARPTSEHAIIPIIGTGAFEPS